MRRLPLPSDSVRLLLLVTYLTAAYLTIPPMKDPQLHALNIITLATWLSLSAFAVIAICVPSAIPRISGSMAEMVTSLGKDFTLGDTTSAASGKSDGEDTEEETPVAPLPSPPPLPAPSSSQPLPEIPREVIRVRRAAPGNALQSRLAAGKTPGPTYPDEARRKGQAGVVVVQFVVTAAGDVTNAKIYTSSNWPLLDREALRTVAAWKFPPGDVMALIRPIAFQLP